MYIRVSVLASRLLSGSFIVVALGSSLGCGSGSDEPGVSMPEPPSGASAGVPSDRAPAATSDAASVSMSPPSTSPGTSSAALPEDAPVAPGSAAAGDACAVLAGSDACGACVCTSCRSDLDACLAVEGCAEILVCVRESACAGRDCYCGDAGLTECVLGQANGPCMEAVLAAPGGKAPTLTDPSAGPASDAALRVSDCAQTDAACRGVCGLGD